MAEPTPTPPHPAPGLSPDGSPGENTRALQRLIDAAAPGEPTRVAFGPGLYRFAAGVRVPADRWLTLDGGGVARAAVAGNGPLVVLVPSPRPWDGKFTLRDFPSIEGAVTTDGPAQLNRPAVTGCRFVRPGAYALDLATGYCVQPYVGDCVFQGGGIRWVYHPANPEGVPHASSGLVVERCRVNTSHDYRPGPDVHLCGHHQLTARQVICEGSTAGWAAGVDVAAIHRTVGVLVEAPGPRGGSLESVWCEYWNYGSVPGAGPANPTGGAADVRVHNPYAGSAGAYESRAFRLTDVHGSGPVVVSAPAGALTAAVVRCWGCSGVAAEGSVVVIRRLTDELEKRATRTRAPVWAWE